MPFGLDLRRKRVYNIGESHSQGVCACARAERVLCLRDVSNALGSLEWLEGRCTTECLDRRFVKSCSSQSCVGRERWKQDFKRTTKG